MEPVIAELINDIERDKDKACYTYYEASQVQKDITALFSHVSRGVDEEILKHIRMIFLHFRSFERRDKEESAA